MSRRPTSLSALSMLALLSWSAGGRAAESALVFEPPAPDTAVGSVRGHALTYRELPATLQQNLQQNEERYERRRRALDFEYQRAQRAMIESAVNQSLDQQSAELEASSQNATAGKLLAGVAAPAVTDAQVQAFYDQHRNDLKKPFEDVRAQIAEYLKDQAGKEVQRHYLDQLRGKYNARLTLEPVRQRVDASGPARGPATAPVTIVEFADFQCPYCGRMAPVLQQLLAKYPQQVRLVYREFPLDDIHPHAMHAAVSGVCAAEQGKFWELHDALFANQAALGDGEVMKTAEQVGVKLQPFATCLLSAKPYEAVRADVKAGEQAGVTGTPGIFVNGRFYDGYMPLETITAVVEDELRRQDAVGSGSTTTAAVSRR